MARGQKQAPTRKEMQEARKANAAAEAAVTEVTGAFKKRLEWVIAEKTKTKTQQELAEAIDVSPASVSSWMRGTFPDSAHLVRISVRYGVSLDYLVFGTGPQARDAVDPADLARELGQYVIRAIQAPVGRERWMGGTKPEELGAALLSFCVQQTDKEFERVRVILTERCAAEASADVLRELLESADFELAQIRRLREARAFALQVANKKLPRDFPVFEEHWPKPKGSGP
ncbi:MAG TPA: helix-turn-helix domain-containing protein [Gemmatimonas sp.]|nr:helix-turn-helix domain-containing protein [Gemmatimonas sp.]